MSKADGSITPRTLRCKEDSEITKEIKTKINEYDEQFQKQYTLRDQTRSKVLERKDSNVGNLDKLSKYCDDGKLKSAKSQFSKKADLLLKTRESLKVITPDQITETLEFVKIFQHRQNKDIPDLPFDPLKPIVRYYGINASNSSIFIEHVITDNQLHPVELSVFNKAVAHLEKQCSAREFFNLKEGEKSLPKPNNVVLVSFFPRKGNESDKYLLEKNKTMVAEELALTKAPTKALKEEAKEAETHTIALWKTGNKEITIIDPTDRAYSQFLKGILETTYQKKGLTFQIEDSNIDGIDGKIYRPKNGTDKLLKLARDCTDIAVKIAFELNEQQTNHLILSQALSSAIEQISNASLPKEIGLFKALQSSDPEIRIAAKKLIKVMDTKQEQINKIIIDDKVKNKSDQFFAKTLDISKIIDLDHIQEVSTLIGHLDIADIL